MLDIEQKAKGLVLESCLVASSIGYAMRGAIIFVHQNAGCSLQLRSIASALASSKPAPSSLPEISYHI
jgi:hypothetical protein